MFQVNDGCFDLFPMLVDQILISLQYSDGHYYRTSHSMKFDLNFYRRF